MSSFEQRCVSAPALLNVRRRDSEFLNGCCSNQSAVHIDSGLHRSEIATHSLLGGQHGEESEEGQGSEEKEEEVQEEVVQEEVASRIERRDRQQCRKQRRKGRRG